MAFSTGLCIQSFLIGVAAVAKSSYLINGSFCLFELAFTRHVDLYADLIKRLSIVRDDSARPRLC